MSTLVPAEVYASTEAQGVALQRDVAALAVTDQASFEHAAAYLQTIRAYLDRVSQVFGPIVRAAHAAHKTALAQQQSLEAHAREADRILRGRLGAYEQEQARLRREAELGAQRERERLEAEARKAAESERERLRKAAEEQRLRDAMQAEAEGDRERVERLLGDPVPEPVVAPPVPVFVPPVVVAPPPKAAGVSFRERWEFEIVDAARLPREYLVPDDKRIGAVVRALKGETQIPGVRPYPVKDVAVRA